jgi:hypothetical protein
VRRAATDNGYTQPVYLAYAKRKIPAFTVLGEYSGAVVTESRATREEEERKQILINDDPDNADCVRGEVFSKFYYQTTHKSKQWQESLVIDTSNGANELIYLNDFREDIAAGPEAAKKQKTQANVTTIEVVDRYKGKPHMLFMLTEAVEKGDELLFDYQDGFWEAYNAHSQWLRVVRGVRENEQDKAKEKLAVVETERQAAQVCC